MAGLQRSEGFPSTVALREPLGIRGLLEVRSFPGTPACWGTQGTGSRRTQQSEPAQGPLDLSLCVFPEPAVGCAAQSGQPVGQTPRASAVVLSRLGVGRAGAAGGGASGLCQYLTLVLSSRRLFHRAKSGALKSGSSFSPQEAFGSGQRGCPISGVPPGALKGRVTKAGKVGEQEAWAPSDFQPLCWSGPLLPSSASGLVMCPVHSGGSVGHVPPPSPSQTGVEVGVSTDRRRSARGRLSSHRAPRLWGTPRASLSLHSRWTFPKGMSTSRVRGHLDCIKTSL